MKNPSDKYPIVLIEWVDAYGSNEWLDEDEVDENHLNRKKSLVFNIGWLLRKNREVYVISPMLDQNKSNWAHVETLPRQWCKIKVLASPRKKSKI